jgi:hypothetical protein
VPTCTSTAAGRGGEPEPSSRGTTSCRWTRGSECLSPQQHLPTCWWSARVGWHTVRKPAPVAGWCGGGGGLGELRVAVPTVPFGCWGRHWARARGLGVGLTPVLTHRHAWCGPALPVTRTPRGSRARRSEWGALHSDRVDNSSQKAQTHTRGSARRPKGSCNPVKSIQPYVPHPTPHTPHHHPSRTPPASQRVRAPAQSAGRWAHLGRGRPVQAPGHWQLQTWPPWSSPPAPSCPARDAGKGGRYFQVDNEVGGRVSGLGVGVLIDGGGDGAWHTPSM